MSDNCFSDEDIARFQRRAAVDAAVLRIVVERLDQMVRFENHSFQAQRLSAEALRALGAEVPLTRSERLRRERKKDKSSFFAP